jgi:crotonyl-CoA carboxylase/reductase
VVEICDLGDAPPLGVVPQKMHAFAVRQDRFGQPSEAWRREVIPTPSIAKNEVLIYVMATGINYNNVCRKAGLQ